MGRAPRADEAGGIYHALNRGNAKNPIFFKDADYEAFERIIAEGLEKFPIDLIAYQWMKNHWHMVLSPHEDGGMGEFLRWITLTHTQRYHAHHGTTGFGHVYQGRFRSFPVQDDGHFHVVCRYVERNALTANLVKQAQDYRWGRMPLDKLCFCRQYISLIGTPHSSLFKLRPSKLWSPSSELRM